jgi:leader peptidase (prepilin peptidase)/N-methyltransferase
MALLFGWIGAATAGLLCLVVDRRVLGEKIASVHSRCVCGRSLTIAEVAPVIPWLVLRGKARCCKAKLPWRWPFEELGTGIAFYVGVHCSLVIGVLISLAALAIVGVVEILNHDTIPPAPLVRTQTRTEV